MRDDVMQTAGVSIRAHDTLVMVQPRLVAIEDLRVILAACGGDLALEVVGHDATRDVDTFRSQRAKVAAQLVEANTGRPAKIRYTLAQADAIIRAWHGKPKLTLVQVAAEADRILGLPDGTVKKHWVRDLVTKYVGTAQRDKPAGWTGIATDQ